jgi:hypothetical protein
MRALPLVSSGSLVLLFALGSLACKRVGADVSTSEAPNEAKQNGEHTKQDDSTPSYVLLPWGTDLFSAPSADAYAMTLTDPGEGSGRAVAVVAKQGDWWTIETVDAAAVEAFDVQPIEGLDFYRLQLYVPAGTGQPLRPIPPGPDTPTSDANPPSEEGTALDAARKQAMESGVIGALSAGAIVGDPPLQSGYRPPEATTDWRVSPSVPVYWPDGRPAGEVRTEHAFADSGVPAGNDELLCFDVRIGPAELDAGQLCFASADVREAEVMYPGGLWGSTDDEDIWGGLTGAEIEEAYGVGGLGLVGTGESAGGTGEGSIGTIGLGGGGGTGSGYGSGAGGFGGRGSPVTTVQLGKVTVVAGTVDKDIARRIIRAHLNELRQCWDSEKPSGTEGKVSLSVEIEDDGAVKSSKASAAEKDHDAVARCIQDAITKWNFVSGASGKVSLDVDFTVQ